MSININTIKRYPNKFFVETGTYRGGTVLKAIGAGFKEIRSIEVCEDLFLEAQEMFKANKNIKISHGDSSEILFEVIKDINYPITFWLDAHNPNFGKDFPENTVFAPVLLELEQISRHKIKSHTILIDDLRIMEHMGIDISEVKNYIKIINPNYSFNTEKGAIENDILVAKVR